MSCSISRDLMPLPCIVCRFSAIESEIERFIECLRPAFTYVFLPRRPCQLAVCIGSLFFRRTSVISEKSFKRSKRIKRYVLDGERCLKSYRVYKERISSLSGSERRPGTRRRGHVQNGRHVLGGLQICLGVQGPFEVGADGRVVFGQVACARIQGPR